AGRGRRTPDQDRRGEIVRRGPGGSGPFQEAPQVRPNGAAQMAGGVKTMRAVGWARSPALADGLAISAACDFAHAVDLAALRRGQVRRISLRKTCRRDRDLAQPTAQG